MQSQIQIHRRRRPSQRSPPGVAAAGFRPQIGRRATTACERWCWPAAAYTITLEYQQPSVIPPTPPPPPLQALSLLVACRSTPCAGLATVWSNSEGSPTVRARRVPLTSVPRFGVHPAIQMPLLRHKGSYSTENQTLRARRVPLSSPSVTYRCRSSRMGTPSACACIHPDGLVMCPCRSDDQSMALL